MTKERIIDKIQKLMQLANSDNQAEAELAAQRANELLLRHNLTMQQVQAQDNTYMRETVDTGLKRENKLDDMVLMIITRFYFVRIVSGGGGKRGGTVKFHFLGTKSNVEVAIYTYAFLRIKFRALWLAHKRANNLTEKSRQSYQYGLYQGLKDKLISTQEKVQQETGLVVQEDSALREYMNKEFPYLRSSSTSFSTGDRAAMSAGFNAGSNISINKGVSTSSNKRLR